MQCIHILVLNQSNWDCGHACLAGRMPGDTVLTVQKPWDVVGFAHREAACTESVPNIDAHDSLETTVMTTFFTSADHPGK